MIATDSNSNHFLADDELSAEKCSRTVDIYQSVELPPVSERNRGKPLHCVFRIRVRPAREDWVVFVRFTRMRVGSPSQDRQSCDGGELNGRPGLCSLNSSRIMMQLQQSQFPHPFQP